MTEEHEQNEQEKPDAEAPEAAADPGQDEPAVEAQAPAESPDDGEELPPADVLSEAPEASDPSGNLGVIMDLDLPLTVRFGRTQMTLGSLVRIGAGSEINLERSPADPVELMVNGKVIARGDVVAVEGNYAVRITDIVSPSERIANVGG